ncbi:MAG: T9SS type A sorting domain-containing protein [Cyclobacteriaceae bacterium]
MYTPASYQAGTPAPLLVSLHGQAEIGDNISLLTSGSAPKNPAVLINQNQWPADRPFVVLSPQLKRDLSVPNVADQDWPAAYVDEVIEYVKTIRTIDINRIYITGLSLGGQGCMIYSAAYPNKVAGMVPLCGRTDDIITSACSLVNIPMWVFHGTDDPLLNVSNAINMVAAINQCSNPLGSIKPQLTLIEAGRHEIWDPIYNLTSGYQFYDWLLRFSKNNTTNKPPYVNAGIDKKMFTTDGPIYLAGDFFDTDGSITSIQWTQVSGVALQLENSNTSTLKISNLMPGTFQFQLLVTDNLGLQATDLVTINLLTSSTGSIVRNFILMNGQTNLDIDTLFNEQVINKNTLGVSQFNIRAQATNTNSVRFRTNANQNTRTASNFFPANVLIINQPTNLNAPEWQIPIGDYVICATPYSGSNGTGTDGITKCIKLSVYDQPIRNYYPQPNQDLSLLSSWGTATNGTGTPPTSFLENFQIFNINTTAPQNGSLTIGGVESFLWVRNGGEMTVNNNFTGVINVEGTGIVNVNTSQLVAFGSVSPTSTIRFGSNVTSIPAGTYGHVVMQGAGSTKTLAPATTAISGNLVIENDVMVQGAGDNSSIIQLAGNLTLREESIFSPAVKFALTLTGGNPHTLNLLGTKAVFNQLTISGASIVNVNQGLFPVTLEVGSATGGGLVIQNTGELLLNKNHLSVVGQGTINSHNQTGQLGFSKSKLTLLSGTSALSYVYPRNAMDTVSSITVGLSGGGALHLQGNLYVADSLKSLNGTIDTHGFLALVSTENKTACIAEVEGTGDIIGAVQFQRTIQPGRKYRYLSFPVSGIKVSDLQNNVPVTGNFVGASSGPGLSSANPSLFYYQEPTEWIPFPSTSNTEEFIPGRGYSVFIREEVNTTRLALTGNLYIGDFNFSIQPGSENQFVGWNLIGNPYAAPLQWGNDWTSAGINPTIYMRDNDYPGGRFLFWDGQVGDPEFGGLIAQGQSFWVKAITGSPALTVQENNKASTQATFFRTQDESDIPLNLSISLERAGLTDRAYLKFNNRSGSRFDPYYDGVKKPNGYFNLSVLSSDSVSVAIKNLPDSCQLQVALALEDVKPASYSLSFAGSFFDNTVKDLFLHDTYQDSLIQITQQTVYSFAISGDPLSFGKKRFQLHMETRLPEPLISAQGNQLLSNVEAGNQWLLNGEEIPGATESFYMPVESGNYQLRIIQGGCTRTSSPISYVVTGIEKNLTVSLYPNPAGNSITLSGLSVATNYSIRNPLGQEVQKGRILAHLGDNKITFSLAPGIYLVILENESLLYRVKLIVQ